MKLHLHSFNPMGNSATIWDGNNRHVATVYGDNEADCRKRACLFLAVPDLILAALQAETAFEKLTDALDKLTFS